MAFVNLLSKQQLFAELVPRLLDRIHSAGVGVTLGEAWRTDEQAVLNSLSVIKRQRLAALLTPDYPELAMAIAARPGVRGIKLSVHRQRLAIDLNLFRDGVFLTDFKDYEPFGVFWESLHDLCRWGGRFGDGDHFSLEHEGVK